MGCWLTTGVLGLGPEPGVLAESAGPKGVAQTEIRHDGSFEGVHGARRSADLIPLLSRARSPRCDFASSHYESSAT